jgi:RDD family.
VKYPNVLRRYLATVVDLFALWCIFYAISQTPALTERGALAYWILAVSLLLYEPLLTTYACTLGQAVMRIRVRTVGNLTRIGLDQAFGRMIVKYLLGIISFLTVPARQDRRAIHDLSSGTIVIEAGGSAL